MTDSIKNQVRAQFARHAYNYVVSQGHAKGEDLNWLVSNSGANPGMTVLDIATGGGHVANALVPLVKHVTACDLTEDMLKTAAEFIRGNGHANVDFVVGDAEALPFEDAYYDLVTCRIAAHHFPDVPTFLAEAFRVLKPGGRQLLIDNVGPEDDSLDQIYHEIEKRRDPSHVRALKKSEWVNLLERCGFRLETVVLFPKTFLFREWCERVGLPEPERVQLESYILQAPSEVRSFFSVQTDSNGELLSFMGEAAYFQAVKL